MNKLDFDNLDIDVLENEPLAKHCFYKIGGPAKYFVVAHSVCSLKQIIKFYNENNICYLIIGKGSNILFSDNGFDGAVITLGEGFKEFSFDKINNIYNCGAAVSLSKLVNHTRNNYYKGLEFALGTPGNIGGAVKMNAGSSKQWIANRIVSVKVLNNNLEIEGRSVDKIDWGYRYSSFKKDEIILSAKFKVEPLLDKNKQKKLLHDMDKYINKRKFSQPLNYPSCGSVFKNPDGFSAGKLIEDCGLKGTIIGGAKISDIHANFIINLGNAKANDVVELIKLIQSKVYEKFSVKLALEVKTFGFSDRCIIF